MALPFGLIKSAARDMALGHIGNCHYLIDGLGDLSLPRSHFTVAFELAPITAFQLWNRLP
jgi:hypothetical protein